MTRAELALWWHNPALKPLDQHPIAHALGGLVLVAVGAWDLLLVRSALGEPLGVGLALGVLLAASLAIEVTLAVPLVRDENDGRLIRFEAIITPFAATLLAGAIGTALLPWAWKPWVLATAGQAVWEEFQIAAWWNPSAGRSDYPTYSAVLDAATASLIAALATIAARPILHLLGGLL